MIRSAILTLVMACVCVTSAPGAGKEQAPALDARDLDGRTISLKTLAQGGPVVVAFWATWCKPCTKELPQLQRIVSATPGASLVAVNQDGPRNRAKLRPFWSRLGMTAPIVLDDDGAIGERFRVVALPTTIVIDRGARVAFVHQGYRPGDEIGLGEEIASLAVADSTAPAPQN